MRVCLGKERRIDVARSYGYADGSAITQILKRLDQRVQAEPKLRLRMEELEKGFQRRLSSVKS